MARLRNVRRRMRPTCCNRNATPYLREWNVGSRFSYSWEQGYRCKKCGRDRLPFMPQDTSYMDAMEAVRLQGVAFDAELELNYERRRQASGGEGVRRVAILG
jgi:transposase-like protein